MRVLWANSANSWPACVGSTRQVVHTNSGVPSSSSNVRMVMLRSPATIMKLAQEQGALCEIERLTFFKSLETFDHPRSMQIIAEGVETAAELRKVISWARMRCRATSLQNLPPCRPKWHLPPGRSLPSTALHPTAAEYEHKKSRRNAGLFASATGVLQFAAVYWNRANNSTGGAFLLWYR